MAGLFKRRGFRGRIAIIIVGICVCFYLLIFLLKMLEDDVEDNHFIYNAHKDIYEGGDYPILLWWTPFTGEHGIHKKCGREICFFTDERKYFSNLSTKGLLFYGSDFKPTDLPLPRLPHHDWALLHEESPKNNYLFSTEKVMKMFNHTATFRRESDLPLTFQYLDSLLSLTSDTFYVPTHIKNSRLKELAPVVYIQSDCNTPSNRDAYVEELMKHIRVDSYGKCLHNKDLPPNLTDAMTSMNNKVFWKIISQYKFTLAFENAICEDYITEKLWRPLILGSIPVYYGAPTIKDWLPNPNSAILVADFEKPGVLADHLLKLHADDKAYEAHLEHKIHRKISNKNLVEAMVNRKWGINNDPEKNNFIEQFECMVCKRVSRNHKRQKQGLPTIAHNVQFNHYGCPKPVSLFTAEPDFQNWWLELYNKATHEARALENLINTGKNFSMTDFYQEVIHLLENEANM